MSSNSSSSGHHPGFPTTRWTVVERMSHGKISIRQEGWDAFVRSYWSVLVTWMQARGISRAEAEDLVQGLMQKLWKTDDLRSRIKMGKVRLRTYLLASLQNWWRDEYRKEKRIKRGGEQSFVSFTDSEHGDFISDHDGAALFDQEWAQATVRKACDRLRDEYAARKNERLFDEGFSLIGNPDEEKRKALGKEFGMTNNSLTVSLKRLRERLIRKVREEVEATLSEPSEEDIRDEVRHLLAALASTGGLDAVMRLEK